MGAKQMLCVLLTLTCAACGTDEPYGAASDSAPGLDPAARDELLALGVDKYFGKFEPAEVMDWEEFISYEFTPDDEGPVCLRGDPFRMAVRESSSPDLLIYLQGGGACWSAKCAANEKAVDAIMPIGWTDADTESNPTLSRFDTVFVSYCDGSVFSGDNIVRRPDGSIERRHRGLANLSAALDVARQHFPTPRRVVLAGSSAGGYGTILGTAVVRLAYPSAPLFVINDAGLGLTNPEDPTLITAAQDEWGVTRFVPDSCQGCVESGQFTRVIDWSLTHDSALRVGAFSSYQDGIIGGVFLGMEPEEFQALMLKETDAVHAAHPDRFQRFFIEGGAHTAILAGYYDVEVKDVRLLDWVDAMLAGSAEWRDLLQ